MTESLERLALVSMDPAEDRLKRLREAFPEVFVDNRVDFDALRRALGDRVETGKERFGLHWPGKADCIRAIQQPSVGTLLPVQTESLNFDKAEHLVIEGDNLEVLKLLQKSYYGKVKLIYIDPPYNTGGEFIYPDNYREGLQEYLRYSGQVDASGVKLTTNTETDGRYHSKWLSMMYPRLFLARNLMRDDGVICVSIDENEIGHLFSLMNEIFGEENREGLICWRRRHNQPNDRTKMIGKVAEFIVVYARDSGALKRKGVGKIDLTGDFSNSDGDPLGDWASKPWKVGSDQSGSRYKIEAPNGTILDEEWMGDEERYRDLLAKKRIYFPKNGSGMPRKKYYRFEREEEGQCATNWWSHEDFGHNQGANATVAALLGAKNVFSNPKPVELIRGMLQIANVEDDDLVLDFFAGSGTTGHAVLDFNRERGTCLRFVLVQLPEPLSPNVPEHEVALSLGFRTIADVTRKRLHAAAAPTPEVGIRSLRLAASNFKPWAGDGIVDVSRTLQLFADNVLEGRNAEDLTTEILLKSGFLLTSPVARLTLAGKEVTAVEGGALLICVDRKLSLEVIEAMVERRPAQIVCLDIGFQRNDQLKVNAIQTVKSKARSDESTMVFRVV